MIAALPLAVRALLRLQLAARLEAPAVEAHHHYYRYTVQPQLADGQPECDTAKNLSVENASTSWAQLGGRRYCTVAELRDALATHDPAADTARWAV